MRSRFIICMVSIITLLSCNNDAKYIRDIKRLTHQKIEFPLGYEELSCNSQQKLESLTKQDIKIVSYYGEVVCTSCCAKNLKMWQNEIKEIDKDIAYIIVAHCSDKEEFVNFADSLYLDYPLMYYDSDVFGKQNKLEDILARNRTFLLNKDNEIVLVGEPFGREQLSKLYKKCIDSLRVQR